MKPNRHPYESFIDSTIKVEHEGHALRVTAQAGGTILISKREAQSLRDKLTLALARMENAE